MGHEIRDLAAALAAVDARADVDASVLLIQRAGTVATGDLGGNRTAPARALP